MVSVTGRRRVALPFIRWFVIREGSRMVRSRRSPCSDGEQGAALTSAVPAFLQGRVSFCTVCRAPLAVLETVLPGMKAGTEVRTWWQALGNLLLCLEEEACYSGWLSL